MRASSRNYTDRLVFSFTTLKVTSRPQSVRTHYGLTGTLSLSTHAIPYEMHGRITDLYLKPSLISFFTVNRLKPIGPICALFGRAAFSPFFLPLEQKNAPESLSDSMIPMAACAARPQPSRHPLPAGKGPAGPSQSPFPTLCAIFLQFMYNLHPGTRSRTGRRPRRTQCGRKAPSL